VNLFLTPTVSFINNHNNNSFAFLLYSLIVFVINTYATTGRNAPSKTTKVIDDSNIELITPGGRREWYNRVPSGNNNGMQDYVIGDDEEDELAPR
jgi:hypothetical protein